MKRGRFLIGALLLLVTAVVLFYVVVGYQGARDLQEARRELEEKGEPFDFRELIPPPIPDDQNLAMHHLFADLDWENGERTKDDPFKLPNLAGEVSVPSFSGLSRKGYDLSVWRPYVLARYEKEASFAGMSDAELIIYMLDKMPLDELHTAVRQRPLTRWPIHYDLLFDAPIPYFGMVVNAARMLNFRAQALLSMGRTDEAREDLITALKLARASGQDGLIIGMLVEIVIASMVMESLESMLQFNKWEEAQMTRMREELEAFDFLKDCRRAWRFERAVFQEMVIKLSVEDFRLLSDLSENHSSKALLMEPVFFLYPEGWKNADVAFYIKTSQEYIIEALHTEEGWVDILKVDECDRIITQAMEDLTMKHIFTALSLPIVNGVIKKVVRCEARKNMLLTANMVEEFKGQHQRLPESLDELVGSERPLSMVDPATGESLFYRKDSADGYTLYSLGWNRKDDGADRGTEEKHHKDAKDWVLQVR